MRITSISVLFGLLAALSPAYAQSAGTGEVNFKATSANVRESGVPVRIRITRWSTDEERTPLVAALSPAPAPAAPARAGGSGGGAAAAGRGGAGRGGRGGAARGARGDAGPAITPIAALTAAIGKEPTLGYIWTNEVTGYSIKYAYRTALPGGGERIILATDRRLGGYTPGWTPVGATPLTDYDFTVVEMRLDAKGAGEAKASLTTKVVVDPDAKTVALENYAAAPAIFQNVKR
jgi:hypothetical protein